MRKKLLIWCDSPTVPTGFGVVAKNLFKDMYKQFEVGILGINYYGDHTYDTSKYFIYSIEKMDPLGFKRLLQVIKDFKPDVLFLFQDVFHIDLFIGEIKKNYKDLPIVVYFPIDGTPVSQSWSAAFLAPDKLMTYSQFAVDAVRKGCTVLPAKKPIDILYHGIDTTAFYKQPSAVRRRVKEEKGWDGKFVVINNNRFQPRKLTTLSFRAFALFSKGYKICDCGNIYLAQETHCDLNKCDISHVVATSPPKPDVVLYLHMNAQEYTMGPGNANLLQSHLLNVGFVDPDLNKSLYIFDKNSYVHGDALTEAQLNEIYNAADLNITTTLGEGYGLALGEASAVGTTSIAPNNSAIPEVLGDTGYLIPNRCLINIAQDNGHLRPVVDLAKFVQAMDIEYNKWVANGRKKIINEAAIERVNKMFLWEDKRIQLTAALKSVC